MTNTSIGEASGSNVISGKGDVWNIADGFTKIKILRILIELDLHETIAIFGRKDQDEMLSYEEIAQKRVEALHRMLFSIRQLVGNCKFTIELKNKAKINKIMERINVVENVIDGISRVVSNDITKEEKLTINEPHFMKCFEVLRDIKDEINVPINEAGLIFRKSDDIDLDSLMRNIIEGD